MKTPVQKSNFHRTIAQVLVVLCSIFGSSGIAQAECLGGIGADDIVISNKSADFYISGDVVDCVTTGSITLGPYVTIPDRVTFNLTAPQVTVNENVEVLSGGELAVETMETGTSICVDSVTVKCMGALPEWPSGTLFGQFLKPGQIHVWHFDYSAAQNGEGSFLLFDGYLKIVSTSLIANDFTLSIPCQITQVALQQPLHYAAAGSEDWYQCGFEDGKRYYLNIKSTVNEADPYALIVY